MKRVGLIPLDDRPCTRLFPQRLGKIGAVDVEVPSTDHLGYFLREGNPEELTVWLENNCSKWDGLIVSADMLAYGGLIASRRYQVPFEKAMERLNVLRRLRKLRPDMPVYASNILMRLSITVSGEEQLRWWEKIHRYSQLKDSELLDSDKGVQKELQAIERAIPQRVLNEYLSARNRNHQINCLMIQMVRERIVDFLVIGQEDAAPYGVHREEQRILADLVHRWNLEDRVKFVTGADELSMELLARLILDQYAASPRIRVIFSSRKGAELVAPFEDRPIVKNVSAHMALIGSNEVEEEDDAEILLFVNTPGKKAGDHCERPSPEGDPDVEAERDLDEFVCDLKEALKTGRVVAVADVAYCNGSDPRLIEEMRRKQVPFSKMAAYAGWNTAGNTLGTALSQAVIYWWARRENRFKEKENAFFLLERLADDWLYQVEVRPIVQEEIRKAGLSPWNLKDERHRLFYGGRVAEHLLPKLKDFIENHWDGGEKVKPDVAPVRVRLPWPRTFEAEILVEQEERTGEI